MFISEHKRVVTELPMQVWDLVHAFLPKYAKAQRARDLISTFEMHGVDVSNNCPLWHDGYKACNCFDPETLSPDPGHVRCGGTGWLKA